MNNIFLSGWGISAHIWQHYVGAIESSQYIDLPDFSNGMEERVIDALQQRIAPNSTIYAWSLSGLWLLRLLQQNQLAINKIYFYAPPFQLNMTEDKKYAFIRQFDKNPKALAQKFLKLINHGAANKSRLAIYQRYEQLTDMALKQHWLNHLKWMMHFSMSLSEMENVLANIDYQIIVGEHDVIVDVAYLSQFKQTKIVIGYNHHSILSVKANDALPCDQHSLFE